jgi:hypothetical protein
VAKLTIVFGVLLMAVGVGWFVGTGSRAPTALIPSVIGLILAIAGALALNPARRMLWMHIAVTVGLLGFLATIKSAYQVFELAHGVTYPRPQAILEQSVTCLLCMLFVAFCVRSFIEARRARVLGA